MTTNEPFKIEKSGKPNPALIPDCADLEVSRTGYELWRAAGRPVGRYMEFLAQAEREYKKNVQQRAH